LVAFLAPLTILQAVVAILACLRPSLATKSMFGIALGLYALAGAILIARAPAPRIDVFVFQQGGAAELERGRDPYASTFPNPYSREETRAFFGDERTELREYPYPPLSLLAATAGHVAGGDVRWTLLASQLGIAALLFALATAGGHSASVAIAIATLHLLHPRGLFVLYQAWTDSMVACAFLLVVLLMQLRRGRWLGLALGFFVAIKQYSVMALPLLLRNGRIRSRAWIEALLVGSAITIPFLLWSPSDFFSDVVLFQLRQPFRPDALSIPALVASVTGWRAPGILALVGAAAALALTWARIGPRAGPGQLLLAAALLYAGFFLSAKQAFCNYYYFVGALILGAAALPVDAAPGRAEPP
jgi:hypothetical protein